MSVMTYETLKHGERGAQIVAEHYEEKLKRVVKATKNVVNKCTSNFKTNMQTDLEAEMGRQSDHGQLSETLKDKFKRKYDWMNIAAWVYNDIHDYVNHAFDDGSCVFKLRHHSKNAIVFYRDYAYGFQNRYKMNKFTKAAKEGHQNKAIRRWYTPYWRAELIYDNIYRSHGSQLWGLAVIRRHVNLYISSSTFSGNLVWDVGRKFTICLLVK